MAAIKQQNSEYLYYKIDDVTFARLETVIIKASSIRKLMDKDAPKDLKRLNLLVVRNNKINGNDNISISYYNEYPQNIGKITEITKNEFYEFYNKCLVQLDLKLIRSSKTDKIKTPNKKGYYHEIIFNKLDELELNENFEVEPFIEEYWNENTLSNRRSFDVMLSRAKKDFIDKKFKTVRGTIVRIQ